MGQYPMLYLLVEPDRLLAGLPSLQAFEKRPVSEADPDKSWAGLRTEYWSSLERFAELLSERLGWLRSVGPAPHWHDDTRALGFRLHCGDQWLAAEATNWMQLVLPERLRQCLLIGVEVETMGGKHQNWFPLDHPVRPLLFDVLRAIQPVFGMVRDDDVSYPCAYTFGEGSESLALEQWENVWRMQHERGLRMNCGYVGAVLASTVRQEQAASGIEQELGHLVEIEGGGFWFTRPGSYSRWREWDYRDEALLRHYAASEQLSDLLNAVPDSAIFPGLTS